MNLYYILDKDKNVVPAKDVYEWAKLIESDKRIIAKDIIGDCTVSTIFVGLMENLFETAIFKGRGVEIIVRYKTYEEALEGHKRAVEEVTKKLDGDAIE